MAYDPEMSEQSERKGGWLGLYKSLGPFLVPPFIILLPLVLMALIAFWIYVWVTRDRRRATG